ncbi:MAG: class I SAM-dependent methyltransferase [Desulfobacterales bacterium]|nr:MAG: class I SAM-dependent methyltransferase [Desulfobacterales bacterium]
MINQIYQILIKSVTDLCYQTCLAHFSKNASILDVGIGNGIMIKKFHDLIKSKDLKITGIDINQNYLKHCDSLIKKYALEKNIEIHCKPVEAYEPGTRGLFDFIFFSMSFMLFNDQSLVLKRLKDWIKPGGEIVFFQTMYTKRLRMMEAIKPNLKYVTGIDFGSVTYEKDFFALLKDQGVLIKENRLLKRKWFQGEYRMIVTTLG